MNCLERPITGRNISFQSHFFKKFSRLKFFSYNHVFFFYYISMHTRHVRIKELRTFSKISACVLTFSKIDFNRNKKSFVTLKLLIFPPMFVRTFLHVRPLEYNHILLGYLP